MLTFDVNKIFQALPAGFLAPYTEAIEGVNNDKNRFANILPYDKSRVILPELPGVPHSDYINASYVDVRSQLVFFFLSN